MRAFVTGASGFVGTWLTRHLEEMGDEAVALAEGIDVTDTPAVAGSIAAASPDVVYHLAALTHVGDSWEVPEETFRVNAMGTLSVLEAARKAEEPPRIVLVSSAEVYGPGWSEPIDETMPLRPVTPYAASKVAAEYPRTSGAPRAGTRGHPGAALQSCRAGSVPELRHRRARETTRRGRA